MTAAPPGTPRPARAGAPDEARRRLKDPGFWAEWAVIPALVVLVIVFRADLRRLPERRQHRVDARRRPPS